MRHMIHCTGKQSNYSLLVTSWLDTQNWRLRKASVTWPRWGKSLRVCPRLPACESSAYAAAKCQSYGQEFTIQALNISVSHWWLSSSFQFFFYLALPLHPVFCRKHSGFLTFPMYYTCIIHISVTELHYVGLVCKFGVYKQFIVQLALAEATDWEMQPVKKPSQPG